MQLSESSFVLVLALTLVVGDVDQEDDGGGLGDIE